MQHTVCTKIHLCVCKGIRSQSLLFKNITQSPNTTIYVVEVWQISAAETVRATSCSYPRWNKLKGSDDEHLTNTLTKSASHRCVLSYSVVNLVGCISRWVFHIAHFKACKITATSFLWPSREFSNVLLTTFYSHLVWPGELIVRWKWIYLFEW